MNQQMVTMLRLQDQMNRKVHAEWRHQGFEWYRAIWIECAELMDHHGWKWWKKQTPERDQVVLELIDIWHFGLSDLLQGCDDVGQLAQDVAAQMDFSQQSTPFLELVEQFTEEVLSNRKFSVEKFTPLLASFGVGFDQLYCSYVGKNVLNLFRQDHGYLDGRYRKQWLGREDNEHLVELVEELDSAAEDYQQQLYAALKERYNESLVGAE